MFTGKLIDWDQNGMECDGSALLKYYKLAISRVCSSECADQPFYGFIDDLLIYDRWISDEDIFEVYKSGIFSLKVKKPPMLCTLAMFWLNDTITCFVV